MDKEFQPQSPGRNRIKQGLYGVTLALLLLLPVSLYAGGTTTSGVTAQTVIDRVRADLNETTASFWTDTQLVKWMDEAVKEIVYKTRCVETGTSLYVVKALDRYVPFSGSTMLDIEKVEHESGVTWVYTGSGSTRFDTNYIMDLERQPFRNLRSGNDKETGRPKVFSVWNNRIYFYPIADEAQAGTTLYVYYIPYPTGVTASASPIETPSYFDLAIYDYVKAKALLKDSNPNADYFLKSFNQRIVDYIVNVLRRNVFEYPRPTQ
jgi:hypothetical protein